MQKRPFGVAVISSLMIVIGGFSTLIIFIIILDSVRIYGFSSILISSPAALIGFMLYGLVPVLFYAAGVSLYMARKWARTVTVTLIPLASFLLFINWKYRLAHEQTVLFNPGIGDVVYERLDFFLLSLLQFFLVFIPIEYYFHRPHVMSYFHDVETKPVSS